MLTIACVVSAGANLAAIAALIYARRTIRRQREELDMVWNEYEAVCGTVAP